MGWRQFIYILIFIPSVVWAASDIDIFIKGVHYPSIEAYRASKILHKNESKVIATPSPAKVFEDISEVTANEWKLAGAEHSVGQVVVDFTQNWNAPIPKFKIQPKELEDRFKSLVDGRKSPVLIVAGDNKLRVMELRRE